MLMQSHASISMKQAKRSQPGNDRPQKQQLFKGLRVGENRQLNMSSCCNQITAKVNETLKSRSHEAKTRELSAGVADTGICTLKGTKNSETECWSENWGKCLLVKSGFTSSNSWCLNLTWVESCLRWVRELKIVSSEETRLDVLRHRNDVSAELGQ